MQRHPAMPILILLIAALLATAAAGAQNERSSRDSERSSRNSELLLSGPQMVVTASKTTQDLRDSPSSVTVITSRDIERQAWRSLPDILRSVVGVDVSSPNRSQENVSIRGFNETYTNNLLVMVDGRTISNDLFGGVFWNTFPLVVSAIKRIEVVRGPGSALYGADAFNGVVNIITFTPEELASRKHRAQTTVSGGTQGTLLHAGVWGERLAEGWNLGVAAGYSRTSGYGERAAGAPRDSFTTPTFTATLQHRTGAGTWTLAMGTADAVADLSSEVAMLDANWRTRYASLTYQEHGQRAPLMLRAYGNFCRAFGDDYVTGDIHDYNLEAQQQRALGPRHTLIYGSSFREMREHVTTTGPDSHDETLWNGFIQDQYRASRDLLIYLGARADTNSQYGSNLSPRASVVKQVGDGQTIRFSWGTAFKAPTFQQSYQDIIASLGPGLTIRRTADPDLKPERTRSLELGYRRSSAGGYVEVTAFDTRVADLIGYRSDPADPLHFVLTNGGDARNRGVEVDSRFALHPGLWGLFNYAFQNARYANRQPVSLSPRHKLNIGILYDTPHGLFGSCIAHFVDSTLYAAERPARPVPSTMRLDLKLGQRLRGSWAGWDVAVAATNLFNNPNVELPSSAVLPAGTTDTTEGRSVWLSVRRVY